MSFDTGFTAEATALLDEEDASRIGESPKVRDLGPSAYGFSPPMEFEGVAVVDAAGLGGAIGILLAAIAVATFAVDTFTGVEALEATFWGITVVGDEIGLTLAGLATVILGTGLETGCLAAAAGLVGVTALALFAEVIFPAGADVSLSIVERWVAI